MIEWSWAVFTTALIPFCIIASYFVGYRRGAQMVLKEWRAFNNLTGVDRDE